MGTFNMGSISSQAPSDHQLAPWGIYDVKFTRAEIIEFKGKKDPAMTYKALSIRFDSPQGYYNERLFYPRDDRDDARGTFRTKKGGTMTVPSRNEETMVLLSQITTALAPENYNMLVKDFSSFDELARTFINAVSPAIGRPVQVKLEGRTNEGKVYPCFPRIARVRNGNLEVTDNAIGTNLKMTEYQQKKAKDYAAPATQMNPTFRVPDVPTMQPTASNNDDDEDFDSMML